MPNRLLSLDCEQSANAEVFSLSGICVHPLKDLRHMPLGAIFCSCCGSRVRRGSDENPPLTVKPGNSQSYYIVKSTFADACRLLFGWETSASLVYKCMGEWNRLSLCLGWNLNGGSNVTSKKGYMAYALYRVCHSEGIYRTAKDIASVCNTSEAKLLLAEDVYCMESGSSKIYTTNVQLFQCISKWNYLTYEAAIYTEKIIERIERRLYGKAPETIIMIALRLAKKYIDRANVNKSNSASINLRRASKVLAVSEFCGENTPDCDYEKILYNEIRDLIPISNYFSNN